MKYFKDIVYGTQYYRAPTPMMNEWEGDITKMEELGIEAMQIRVQWRQNERGEDNYYFDDVDRLFDLAEKYNKKVVFNEDVLPTGAAIHAYSAITWLKNHK